MNETQSTVETSSDAILMDKVCTSSFIIILDHNYCVSSKLSHHSLQTPLLLVNDLKLVCKRIFQHEQTS